ncbi:electron transfer flavoprotein subunit alpha/FixB family protein [Comamonas aquatica]|jgi:electron transfer flavoprotein alpha subunit|uniref:electron transfer flavoprotein subunit alpha/FixB family protein n=1 Tax=Comamonas aquatica TaxID=225991 RepID=UPI002446EEC7|nr:FAD-binding protein [Comamonas aquatica]MBS1853714.1 FAD-binding protein [Acidobacteriota bacterium]MDH0201034.1 FAD-binding protein [Comamonas aquatica]MDH1447539.1 FAD-binding protein [Comamonas aquatica]MDH1766783.1 FAD-binding protein [Comamonas aquatica]
MAVLIVGEHDHQGLNAATLCAVQAAAQVSMYLDGGVHLLLTGSGLGDVAAAALHVNGVGKVLCIDAPHLQYGLPEEVAVQVLSVASSYSHVLFPATAWGKGIAPRVAARLNTSQVSEVIAVQDARTYVRPIYAGNVLATVHNSDAIQVLTIRATGFSAAATQGGMASVEKVAASPALGRSRFVNSETVKSDRPELASARVVVSGGRGLGSKENFTKVIVPLADALGAAVGASRAAVDAGYAPNDWQVGQTGKVVAPQLYVAVGISGAIQHLAGMKDSKVIVAINTDADAPIFGVADYFVEADLFKAVPEWVEALSH